MLEGDKLATAMRKSRTLVAGNFRQIAVIIWGWGLLILAVAGGHHLFAGWLQRLHPEQHR